MTRQLLYLYRRDATIFNALYEVVPIHGTKPDTSWLLPDFSNIKHQKLDQKAKSASWLVSKCSTPSKREELVELLRKTLEIDTFGRCGLKPLLPRTEARLETYKRLLGPYYFYLSFENSRCKDYITEKFYNVLASQSAIPVVYGPSRVDYEAVAPAHSFIHVEDYDEAATLSDYLHFLERNSTAYSQFFWWTSFYKVRKTAPACSLCRYLNEVKAGKRKPAERIRNFNRYWVAEATCNISNVPWIKDISNSKVT